VMMKPMMYPSREVGESSMLNGALFGRVLELNCGVHLRSRHYVSSGK
jgi:hypothetical protein